MSKTPKQQLTTLPKGVKRLKREENSDFCRFVAPSKLTHSMMSTICFSSSAELSEEEAMNDAIKDADEEEEEIVSDYDILCLRNLRKQMSEIVGEIQAITELDPTLIRVLLNRYNWDKEQFLEKYYASDSGNFVASTIADILGFSEDDTIPLNSSESINECPICFSMEEEKMIALKCNHYFCSECWSNYVVTKIMEDNCTFITCPAYRCHTLVDDNLVISLLPIDDVKDRYDLLMTNTFVECNRVLRWCPKPDCNHVIKVPIKYTRPVRCVCETVFCFDCGDIWHETLSCLLYKIWIEKCEDKDAKETLKYICSHTKNCPKCSVTIEKNGGCNHIKCTKCYHDFCWSCMGSMAHSEVGIHRCNSYDNSENEKHVARCRVELQRFLFYCNRYTNHYNSLVDESQLSSNLKNKVATLQAERDSHWMETKYLTNAAKVLCRCRRTLMFTYIFAYFLKKSNQQQIFEENQNDLENAVERLSRILAADEIVIEDKCKIMDIQAYCEARSRVLLKHVKEGYDNDWWEFMTDLI